MNEEQPINYLGRLELWSALIQCSSSDRRRRLRRSACSWNGEHPLGTLGQLWPHSVLSLLYRSSTWR